MFLKGPVRLRQRETLTDDPDTLNAAASDDPMAYTVREQMVMEAIQALPYAQRTVMGLTIAEFTPAEIAASWAPRPRRCARTCAGPAPHSTSS
ncbi:hypothetical protein Acsp04_60600 [Actinomadura sp. NBRC 104425]|uniref:hypothetical protein n=1 Tax=Actinomadura sp. NBRC 104425 TaxID=3032204 RepID=UPI0024A4A083|nr:hypothetical protein [Actinomadura sp. NBRC 104425]GLZ15825.1 hypothetical protein Acsp04_60600 [Actinomadura sp. NBRC 104425]